MDEIDEDYCCDTSTTFDEDWSLECVDAMNTLIHAGGSAGKYRNPTVNYTSFYTRDQEIQFDCRSDRKGVQLNANIIFTVGNSTLSDGARAWVGLFSKEGNFSGVSKTGHLGLVAHFDLYGGNVLFQHGIFSKTGSGWANYEDIYYSNWSSCVPGAYNTKVFELTIDHNIQKFGTKTMQRTVFELHDDNGLVTRYERWTDSGLSNYFGDVGVKLGLGGMGKANCGDHRIGVFKVVMSC